MNMLISELFIGVVKSFTFFINVLRNPILPCGHEDFPIFTFFVRSSIYPELIFIHSMR